MNRITDNISPMALYPYIAVLVGFFASFNLYALEQSRYWQPIGPEGGSINHFVTNQTQADIIYASSKSSAGTEGAYFKSINAGKSWVALATVPNSISYSPYNIATGLAVDSQNPHILYAYSVDGLLKSTDNGMHWQQLGRELDMDTASFFALNPYVTQSLRVFTHTDERYQFGMVVSENAGLQWHVIGERVNLFSVEKNIEILLETSDVNNPDILYGVSYSPGDFGVPIYPPLPEFLYKSINAGLDWVNITPAETAYSGKSLTLTVNSEKLYATFGISEWGGGEQTLMSDNGGIDWQALGTPSESSVDFNLFKIYLDPADAQILYANVYTANRDNSSAYPNRIAKSYDAGSTWQVIDVSPYQPGKIVVNAQNNQQLLMTSGQGVLRSENGGLDWEPSNKGIYAIGGRLSVASNDSDVMYLVQGGYKGRKYKSMDAGQHWQELSRGEISDSCYAIHINPIHNQEIICQSSSGLYRSFDAGVHWEIFSNVANTGLVYAQDGKTIYIYNRGEISKSINNGQSWKKITHIENAPDFGPPTPAPPASDSEVPFNTLPTVNPKNPNNIYVSVTANGAIGLYKSQDGGASWNLSIADKTPGERKLLIHPRDPDRLLYFIGSRKVLLSKDGGNSWQPTLELLAANFYSAPNIQFDPDNPNGLYRVINNGIQHSIDNGLNWELISSGLEDSEGVQISASSAVYATTRNGIFKLEEKADFSVTSDCLFNWAEKQYPDLFTPNSSSSQQWGGYTYRYYPESNIYLGFFYQQEVHIKQTELSNRIEAVGAVEYYQELAGCQ